MSYVLLFLVTILSGTMTVLRKSLQKGLQLDFSNFTFYNFVNAAVGSVFLLIACKFQPQFNITTILYALIYTVVVFVSLVATMLFLSKNPVSLLNLSTTAGSLIPSALVGALVFKEPCTLNLVISVLLMLAALVLPYFKTTNKQLSLKTMLFCFLIFAAGGANVILIKFFSATDAHAESMFFLTNLFLFVICGAILFISRIATKQNCKGFTFKQYANIGATTCLSNIVSVLTAYILIDMAVSTFTVLNSSLTLLLGAWISIVIFKEKSTLENNIALALAIIAVAFSI